MKTESEIRAEPHSRRAPEGRGSKPTSSSPVWAVGRESAVHGANVPCVAAGRKDQRHPAVRVEVTTPFPQTERRRHLNNLWSQNATDYSISHHENPCFSAISGHHTSCIPPHTHALDSPSILNEMSWPEVRSDSQSHKNFQLDFYCHCRDRSDDVADKSINLYRKWHFLV